MTRKVWVAAVCLLLGIFVIGCAPKVQAGSSAVVAVTVQAKAPRPHDLPALSIPQQPDFLISSLVAVAQTFSRIDFLALFRVKIQFSVQLKCRRLEYA